MSSVTGFGVSGSSGPQTNRLALLAKLFQTSGKSAQDSKKDPAQAAASPPPPPPPPAHANSAGGLASMFEALQSGDSSSISDLLSRLLQAVDTDGDGTISADELQAVTELTTTPMPVENRPSLYTALTGHDDANGDGVLSAEEVAASPVAGPLGRDFATVDTDSDGQLSQVELDKFESNMQNGTDPAQSGAANVARGMAETTIQTTTAYEALFQALQLVFAQANSTSGTTGSQRYTDLLQSLAKAG
jgi:hypothetical protein